MPDYLPDSLNEEIEITLGLLDGIRKVTPREDLSLRIMGRILEASQPGHFPVLGGRAGKKLDQRFPIVSLN